MNRPLTILLSAVLGVGGNAIRDAVAQEARVVSASSTPALNNVEEQWRADPDDLTRFQPYGLSYGIWQDTEDDERSLEGHFSFKYVFFDCRRNGISENGTKLYELSTRSLTCDEEKAYLQPTAFFSYTGEFDFYMFG